MLQRLSPRGEFLLVNLICFGPFAGLSIAAIARGEQHVAVTDRTLYTMVAIEVVCGALAALLLRARGWKWSDFTLPLDFLQVSGGMLLLIGANIVTASLATLAKAATGVDLGKVTTFEVHVTWPAILLVFLINPLYEELFEVAYNLKVLEGSGAAFAITVSALIRFVCHLYQGPIAAVTILPLGIIFAFVYWRFRRLWPLVVAHGAADVLGLMPQS